MSDMSMLLRKGRRRDVLRAMKAAGGEVTVIEVAAATDIPESYIEGLLPELEEDDAVEIVDDNRNAIADTTYRLADPGAVEEPPATSSTSAVDQPVALSPDAIADDEVRACPSCDRTQIRRRAPSIQADLARDNKEWICKQCGHTFDKAVVRERRHPGPGGGRSTTRAAGGADD